MKMNALMASMSAAAPLATPLAPSLQRIAKHGFIRTDGCCLIADLLPESTNVTRFSFPDRTGYECFINTIHIEDYDDKSPLSQAFKFVMCVFDIWRQSDADQTLVAIVSVDELSVVVRFHVKRPGEHWVGQNLEAYEDPIMLIDSSNCHSFGRGPQ